MMLDNEYILRAAAVVAAALLVAAPSLVGYAQTAVAWFGHARRPAKPAPGPDDAFTIIEIARRFQSSGCKRGVELCQQLIDVLLQPEGASKK